MKRCPAGMVFNNEECIRRRNLPLQRLMELGEIPMDYELKPTDVGMVIDFPIELGVVRKIDVGKRIVYSQLKDGGEIFVPIKGTEQYRKIRKGIIYIENQEQMERRRKRKR